MSDPALNGAAPASGSTTPSATPSNINVTAGGGNAGPTNGQAAAPTASDWTSGFNDDLKGYVQNKGFKTPTDVLDSYRNIEKLVGVPKERLLKLPDRDDSPEWEAVRERLGKPKDAKDYKFEVDNNPANKELADWARKTFHEIGLPKNQADLLAAKFNERNAATDKAANDAYQLRYTQEDAALKKEWGAAHDQNVTVAKRAAQAFGFDGEVIDKLESALGYQGVMKFMQNLGSKLGEDGFVGGKSDNKFNGVMTPEAARQRISAIKNDPDFSARLIKGELSAKEEWDRLHKFASPAE